MKKNNDTNHNSKTHDRSRRQFLKTAGKMAAWIPPALIVISSNQKAFANQSWNNGQGNLDHYGTGNGGPDHYKQK